MAILSQLNELQIKKCIKKIIKDIVASIAKYYGIKEMYLLPYVLVEKRQQVVITNSVKEAQNGYLNKAAGPPKYSM